MNENPSTQPAQRYYYVNRKKVPLIEEPALYAVRFQRGKRSSSPDLPERASRFLQHDSKHQGFVAMYGLQIYQVTTPQAKINLRESSIESAIAQEVQALNEAEAVEFATPVFRQSPTSRSPMLATNRFLVQFNPEVTQVQIDEMNTRYQVQILESLGYAPNGYLLRATNLAQIDIVALANLYYESGLTIFAHPDFITRRAWKKVMSRKQSAAKVEMAAAERALTLPQQWHLELVKAGDAWDISRGVPSIKIAILDDGVETAHPEFSGRVIAQFDFENNTADGNPKISIDAHGTCCASVAAARGLRAYGSAPDCSIIAIRTPGWLAGSDEAQMFRWAVDNGADVLSNSWGPPDGDGAFPLPDATRAAIHYCVTSGRGGKGAAVFFAAGNGNELVSDDGYAANPEVMAVAASTSEEGKAPYSDFGPEIWVCAPSNGGAKSIFAADRQGSSGYNPTKGGPADSQAYFAGFGGTSSATPLVAGIAGLMLSVNPSLTEADVRRILKDTADRIGAASGYDAQGHSEQFGYGRVNALGAVQAAASVNGDTTPTTGTPSISGPTSLSRNASPPVFQVNMAGRRLYAVELASRSELFDNSNHGSERNDTNFYGSWQDNVLPTSSPYTLPAVVWSRLQLTNQLFYRVHVADDASWTNYAADVPDDQAQSAKSIQVGGTSPTPSPAGPTISGPASLGRNASPPVFPVDMAGRRLYAVEVANRANLFDDANHGSERNETNFYGSWQDNVLPTTSPYTLPSAVWSRLELATQLFYRVHVADDSSWTNYAADVPDDQAANAKSIQISGATNGGGTTGTRSVTYPSGAVFQDVTNPTDGKDYSDHVGNGAVILIDVGSRREERLAANFQVKEFAATDGARYARISRELVEGLQTMRDRLGEGLNINSAYRHPALNDHVDGVENSQHIAGIAADIRLNSSSSRTSLDLARMALEVFGCNIGIGLGRNSVHVDLRGTRASWVYEGASLNESGFDTWVQNICADLGERTIRRVELPERLAPAITGPETYRVSDLPPSFYVDPGGNRYYAVEVAADWRLFDPDVDRRQLGPQEFYGSWQETLQEASGPTTFNLPERDWRALRRSPRLYYRLLTASQASEEWPDLQITTPDEQAGSAPWIDLLGLAGAMSDSPPPVTVDLNTLQPNSEREEALWREAGTLR